MRRISRVRQLALGSCLLLLTACGSATSGPDPAGGPADVAYSTVETGHLTVEYPESWNAVSETKSPFDVAYGGDGVELRIAGKFSDDIGAQSTLARLDLPATLSLADYSPQGTESLDVDGAYDALVRTFTYTQDGTPYQGVWIIATQWPYPETSVVALTGQRINKEVVDHIADTLTFTPTKS